jgi:hypothetical protein
MARQKQARREFDIVWILRHAFALMLDIMGIDNRTHYDASLYSIKNDHGWRHSAPAECSQGSGSHEFLPWLSLIDRPRPGAPRTFVTLHGPIKHVSTRAHRGLIQRMRPPAYLD